jgi:hypothetical protein
MQPKRISLLTGRSVAEGGGAHLAGLRLAATVLVRAQKRGLLDRYAEDARCLANPTCEEDDRRARVLIQGFRSSLGSVSALCDAAGHVEDVFTFLSQRPSLAAVSDDDLCAMGVIEAYAAVRTMRGGSFDEERCRRVFGPRLAAVACGIVENSPRLLRWVVEELGGFPKGLIYSAARTERSTWLCRSFSSTWGLTEEL